MLSGETAKGAYPVKAVETMSMVVTEAERLFDQQDWFDTITDKVHRKLGNIPMSVTESCCSNAVRAVFQLQASGVVIVSASGASTRALAKYKPGVPIVCISPIARTARQLNISYGVHAHYAPIQHNFMGGSLLKGVDIGKKESWFKDGDTIVLVQGIEGVEGSTNSVEVTVI
eukprot:gb/GEZN01013755.1/.p1 GENE.gb/GEZN01013755.1/~~gb/GEZN01013755.1/.p1  ORF type:complete len:172 (+),score=16.40 gb/GEZN01013755.1/:389-904(+)